MLYVPTTPKSLVRASLAAAQVIAASPETLNHVKEYDRLGNFNDTNHRFTAPSTGRYLVTASVYGASAGAFLTLLKNGTGYPLQGRVSGPAVSCQLAGVVALSSGDYIEVVLYGAVGATINDGLSNGYAVFSVEGL